MKANLLIWSTVFCALMLSILDMPNWSMMGRPEWVILVLIYWVLAMPERCGVLSGAFAGLCQDLIMGSPLGKHALAYAFVLAIVMVMHKRLRMYDIWHQAGIVFLLILFQYLIMYWVDLLVGFPAAGLWIIFPALISALIWPWLLVVLRSLRRRFGLMVRIG
ncbi:Rod shape-determining protein MreD [BD1-7 clade bacterium]|uniref:Rod shape-determining protein MreD n=1 Tax=BD1-7 clade bacterium TaxID=2029982 RepID=A0A5S9MQD6_9GAMM|nr:Rod shape-determining protein MreD [BD1-7 clade bacterium]CAA0084774.1 Rod shape-determining protein MreD [BD1-7 clade bacterium]